MKTVAEQCGRSQNPFWSLWSLSGDPNRKFDMRIFAAKFVPRLLSNDQKQRRVNVWLKPLEKANEDPTFPHISRIITGDES
jgi:hypothetical protein